MCFTDEIVSWDADSRSWWRPQFVNTTTMTVAKLNSGAGGT